MRGFFMTGEKPFSERATDTGFVNFNLLAVITCN